MRVRPTWCRISSTGQSIVFRRVPPVLVNPGSFFRRIGQVPDERCEATARSSSGSIMVESKVFWNAVGIVPFFFV